MIAWLAVIGWLAVIALLPACASGLDATAAGAPVLAPTCEDAVAAHTDVAGYPTIQGAIDDNEERAVIEVCPGLWAESLVITRSVEVVGAEGHGSRIRGGMVITGASATLTGVWVTGGSARPDLGDTRDCGGGIEVSDGEAHLFGVAITDNEAVRGGGLCATHAGVEVGAASVILRNAADDGGGVYLDNSRIVLSADSEINGNTATVSGGGIYALHSDIVGGLVVQNQAPDGGGIVLHSSTLAASAITANFGSSGGGVYGGAFLVRGAELSGNTATLDGGGLYSYGGSIGVFDSTVQRNVATRGGGGWMDAGTLASVESMWTDQWPDDIAATDVSWVAGTRVSFTCTAFGCE